MVRIKISKMKTTPRKHRILWSFSWVKSFSFDVPRDSRIPVISLASFYFLRLVLAFSSSGFKTRHVSRWRSVSRLPRFRGFLDYSATLLLLACSTLSLRTFRSRIDLTFVPEIVRRAPFSCFCRSRSNSYARSAEICTNEDRGRITAENREIGRDTSESFSLTSERKIESYANSKIEFLCKFQNSNMSVGWERSSKVSASVALFFL